MTNENLTPKNRLNKKKEGEIARLLCFMDACNLRPEDLQRDTGVTVRTITNSIYEDKPLGAKLLRGLHLKYGVSIDWLISGSGKMFVHDDHHEGGDRDEVRLKRMLAMVSEFMDRTPEIDHAWLETQVKLNIAQHRAYLSSK